MILPTTYRSQESQANPRSNPGSNPRGYWLIPTIPEKRLTFVLRRNIYIDTVRLGLGAGIPGLSRPTLAKSRDKPWDWAWDSLTTPLQHSMPAPRDKESGMSDEIRRGKLTRIEPSDQPSEQPIHSPQPYKPRGVQSKGAALNLLLVQATLTKQGRAKGIREIAEHCGLTIGQTRRALGRLITTCRARQIGCGRGTRYLARDCGPLQSENPHQMTPGQKAPQVPLTGKGSGRGGG